MERETIVLKCFIIFSEAAVVGEVVIATPYLSAWIRPCGADSGAAVVGKLSLHPLILVPGYAHVGLILGQQWSGSCHCTPLS